MTDVFKVQDEIANAVVDALKLKRMPDQAMQWFAYTLVDTTWPELRSAGER